MYSNIFDRISFISLLLVLVLLPIFCLPFTNVSVETSKGLLLVLGLAISLVFWALARFADGRISIPKSWLLVSGLGIVIVFLLSALTSGSASVSLFGITLDVGSFYLILAAFILMLMASIIFRSAQKARLVFLGTIFSSALVLIFQGFHVFLPNILSLGILAGKTGNVFGSWNDLGIFAGFACLLFLLVLEFFPVSGVRKIFLQLFILISILFAICVNFPLVWILLGISSLIIFVYKVSITFYRNTEETEVEKKHFPIISFAIVIISLLFFMSGPVIGNYIPNRLGISSTEVRPSFTATMTVAWGVLKAHPVFGIGPNRFGEAWAMYKPAIINNTQFWDVVFSSGSGLLPTLAATTGGLGILSLLFFFALFLVIGVKAALSNIKNKTNLEMVAFFVLSLYLFISTFFYSTGVATFLLALAFAGIFVGLYSSSREKEIQMSFLNDYRKSFFSILGLILIVALSVVASFKYAERFVSFSYFGRAVVATSQEVAESNINKALSFYSNDLYLRTYSQIYLVKLGTIANKSASLSDADKADLQTAFNQAVSAANMATTYDPSNYINFQSLGSLYQSVGVLGVKDAYSSALSAYETAAKLNPFNPGLKLAMANAFFADKQNSKAKDSANAALSLKPDYIDALFFLSQIWKSEGDNVKALSYAQSALSLSPTDKGLIQYINSLSNSSTPVPQAQASPSKQQ